MSRNAVIYILCVVIVLLGIYSTNYVALSMQDKMVQALGVEECFQQLPKYLAVEDRIKICEHNRDAK